MNEKNGQNRKTLVIAGLCGQSVFLSVPHFHAPGETLHASDLFSEPGGKGYNQAVAARRIGAEAGLEVVFAGAVGRDTDGDLCEARLIEEGIVPRLFRHPGERTAYASILTDGAGENRVTVFPGARLTASELGGLEDVIGRAGIVLLTPEIPEDAFAEAVSIARARAVPLIVNPAPFFSWVRPYLSAAWCLTPNRSEAAAMLGCREDEIPDALTKSPYPRVIVTMGGDGALCLNGGRLTKIPAPAVDVKDTTGAGDCFNGALAAFLLEGDDLESAARKAVFAASLSAEHPHALDGMPYRSELEDER